jgi:hypothetical protein
MYYLRAVVIEKLSSVHCRESIGLGSSVVFLPVTVSPVEPISSDTSSELKKCAEE